jgi:hypothetical protein
MRKAAEGHLTTEALMWNQNNQKTISGMSSEDFRSVSTAVFPSFIPVRAGLWRNYILSQKVSLSDSILKIGHFSPDNECWKRERMEEEKDKIIKYFPIH